MHPSSAIAMMISSEHFSRNKNLPMNFEEKVIITPLGAGNEVGRSCIHVKYGNKEILLDCGVHPAHTGVSSLPFLDLIDLSKINAILITHFHLDHAAALPFLTEKTSFKGKVYMTHPTKAILKWLLNDYIRIINSASDQDFYTENDLINCYNKITPIDYHQQINLHGMRFTALNAGHVLGAAMFLIEIETSKLLYTGDFSCEEDRHLKAAESPRCALDALITESTYGVQCHLPREEREHRFTSTVSAIVQRGGKCLLPVFALGRAQELLLILEEQWAEKKHLQSVPIYYVSALAKKCMTVYQTYTNMMNEKIQRISLTRNPFDFKFVHSIKDVASFEDNEPCVMMASPGMLQSGFSRELLEKWCTNERNGVIITGYCVEGTLAKDLLSEPNEIESMRGKMLPMNMSVEYVSFSAHADYTQNSRFIDECKPSNLFFVHGEMNEMMRLKNAIAQKNEKNGIEMALFALRNGENGSFLIKRENVGVVHMNTSKVAGETDVLIVSDKRIDVYDANDLAECEYKKVKIVQKQVLPYNSTYVLLKHLLVVDYGAVEQASNEMRVENVSVRFSDGNVEIEWESNYLDDVIAMAITKSIQELGRGVKSLRMCKMKKVDVLEEALRVYYKEVVRRDRMIEVVWQNENVQVAWKDGSCKSRSRSKGDDNNKLASDDEDKIGSFEVTGEDGYLKKKVNEVLNRVNAIFSNN